MRKSTATSTVVPFQPAASQSFGRRPIAPVPGHLTCLVLVQHQANDTDTELFVSDNGDPVGAVWVPKAMLDLDGTDRGKFLVATVSQAFANQKRLYPRFIDRARFTPEEAAQLNDASALAARTRNRLRGHRSPMSWSGGRNVFA